MKIDSDLIALINALTTAQLDKVSTSGIHLEYTQLS